MKKIENAGLKVNTRYVKTIAVLGVIFTMNLTAQAQESTVNVPATTTTESAKPAESTQQVERVEVIGSRIKRIAKEGASAVKNVGKESMKNSANTSASESLRDSSLAVTGAARERSGGSAAATATIGLRGLGDTRTLVLLNGRRLPKDPSYEAVDLNLIPQGAIERIEVLKDGASALYGSDALGGVINIVTKKGYVGNEASAKISAVEKPGGTAYDISLLSGISGEKSDFLVTLGYTHSDKVFGKDRDLTKDGLSSNGIVPAYKIPTALGGTGKYILSNPAACPADLKYSTTNGGDRCFFRYNEIATTRPQIGQLNLLTDFEYRLESGLKIYNRNIIVHKDIEWNYAPAPITAADGLPNGTNSQPNARALSYRIMEAGNRDNKDSEFNYNALLGLKGNVTSIWEYDVSASYGEISRKEKGVGGFINLNKLLALMGPGQPYDPIAGTGSMASALQNTWQESKSKLLSVDTIFTGELGEMENGAISIATGLGYFNEKLDQSTDQDSLEGNIIGGSGSIDSGSRDVGSVFAEVIFPLTEKLELDAAARLDHYSDFGATVNPKLSAKYNLNSSSLLRASLGTGFKAPTLSQLYGAKSFGASTFIDRKLCKDTGSCDSAQYTSETNGNKDLKEEKAFTASLGAVLQASSNISISVDAWYTKITNLVDLDYEGITQAEADGVVFDGVSPGSYGITVVRDPDSGELVNVTSKFLNLAEEEVAGIDLNIEAGLMDGVLGHQLYAEDDLSYMLFDKFAGFPGYSARDIINEWGHPKWRNTLTLGLRSETSSYALSMRSIPGQNVMDRYNDQMISDLTEFDGSASYKINSKAQVTGGIKNILDSKQPVDSFGGNGGIAEVNNSLYDVNGRKFYVGYTQKF